MQRRRRLRRVAIPNSQALSLQGRDLREAHLQVLLGGSGYRSSNANSSNAVTDPFLSSLILNFPSSKSKDILKSVLSSADDSSVKSVTSSHRWKARQWIISFSMIRENLQFLSTLSTHRLFNIHYFRACLVTSLFSNFHFCF